MTSVSKSGSRAELAVRNHLLFLQDPAQLIDNEEIARLEASAQSTTDPLEKLRIVNRARQLQAGDGDGYRQAFVAHAKTWAEANDILPESFAALGVDEATLRTAGFAVRPSRTRAISRQARRAPRRTQVSVEDVKAAVTRQADEFTLADIAAASGASPMTVRKAIDELVAAGGVKRLGPTPNWSKPGRAPIRFRPIGKRSRR